MAGLKNYYQILGIPNNASPQQVKSVYNQLAMKYHPDKNKEPTAVDKFILITEAYEILSDPIKRADYDTHFKGISYATPSQGTSSVTTSYTAKQNNTPSRQDSTPAQTRKPDWPSQWQNKVQEKIYGIQNPKVRVAARVGFFFFNVAILIAMGWVIWLIGKEVL